MISIVGLLLLLLYFLSDVRTIEVDCDKLLVGQYICPDPNINFIDPNTQQPYGCTKDNVAKIWCMAADGLTCADTKNSSFLGEIQCQWTYVNFIWVPHVYLCCNYVSLVCAILFCRNGYSFDVALLLSVFLGMFGIDRFYLGYPAIGLVKFCTVGGFMFFYILDVILIATQVVLPSDGSSYIIPYYGPGISVVRSDNYTYRRPQNDWLLK